eukprot:13027744-Alexandrium_andersonii.AAC.1
MVGGKARARLSQNARRRVRVAKDRAARKVDDLYDTVLQKQIQKTANRECARVRFKQHRELLARPFADMYKTLLRKFHSCT